MPSEERASKLLHPLRLSRLQGQLPRLTPPVKCLSAGPNTFRLSSHHECLAQFLHQNAPKELPPAPVEQVSGGCNLIIETTAAWYLCLLVPHPINSLGSSFLSSTHLCPLFLPSTRLSIFVCVFNSTHSHSLLSSNCRPVRHNNCIYLLHYENQQLRARRPSIPIFRINSLIPTHTRYI